VLASPRHERHNYNTASRSVSAQSDAGGSPVGVVAVGAICSASGAAAGRFSSGPPDESCLDTSNSTIEFFSSRGPTLDGRVKPDISAIDGVSITGSGGFGTPFFGTSAAAPHMGGLAALLLQGVPCLLNRSTSTIDPAAARSTVRNLILGHAVGLSSTIPDNTFGIGRADALAAVQATLPTRKGSTTLTFDGNTPFGASLTPAQLGFSDPNQCSLARLSWTGGCGTSPGATMTCPVGTSSVSVSASNNGAGFSGTTDLQITVTDFSVATSPGNATLSAGQSATFAVTVSPQGGAFGSDVTLSCSNLPPQATCTFSRPTFTPGAASGQSTLTISTSATASTPPTSVRSLDRTSLEQPIAVSLIGIAMFWLAARRTNRRGVAVCAGGALAITWISASAMAPAMAPGIAVFPASLSFGSQTVGTATPPRLVSITNIGADTLNLANIGTSGDFSAISDCGTTLAAGGSCQAAVSFSPTVAGSRTGTLAIADNATGSPHTINLSGTGVAVPTGGGVTPAGSYAVTVSGVSGTLTHAVNVTLTVQ
jgi:hypothetical protein